MFRETFKPSIYGIGFAAFILLLLQTPIFHLFEHRFGLGLLYGLRGPLAPPVGAAVIAIDKQTISWLRDVSGNPTENTRQLFACLPFHTVEELGRLRGAETIPRPVYACLLDELRRVGFSVVAFDVLFSVSSRETDDVVLAQSLKKHSAAVLLVGYENISLQESGSEFQVQRLVQPLPLIKSSAAASGMFVIPRFGGPVYGYWHRLPEFENSKSFPEEALKLFTLAHSDKAGTKTSAAPFRYFWLYGAPSSVKTISMKDVLSGNVSEHIRSSARTLTAFVGASDASRSYYIDSYPAMFARNLYADISGVELAATAYLNDLSGHRLERLPWFAELLFVGLFALVLGVSARLNGEYMAFVACGLAVAYFASAAIAFSHLRLFVPVITPVFVAAPASFVLAKLVRSKIATELIMRLAPIPIVRRMLSGSRVERGKVQETYGTVVFFDLIRSTSIGETLSEQVFGDLLNDYNDIVTRAVESYGGYVINFTGDGATALFDNSEIEDHASVACKAAIKAIRDIRVLNADNDERGIEPLSQRVGINTGDIAAGSIGAHERYSFSVVGDTVNIASRLEQLGKTLYPDQADIVLVGETTRTKISDPHLSFYKCGVLPISGRRKDETVFRLTFN